jgi:PAS domain S-box-containing protein
MELSQDTVSEILLNNQTVVIVVEDDEGLNKLVQKNLQREGFQTEGLFTGKDTLDRVLKDQNVILVLDYKLPDMTGKDIVAALSGEGFTIPFIIVTGHGDERIAVEMMKMGARDYIIKDSGLMDVIPHVLKRVIDELINEGKLAEAERSLQKSEERYRRITSAITDYIYTVRIESGRPVATKHGEACFAVTGYTTEEFAGDDYLWIRIVVEEDHEIIRRQVDHVLAGLSPPPVEHRIIRKDGVMRWVESTVVPSFDPKGNLVSYDGIIRDISERKEAERALRISEEKFSKAFRSGPTLITISTLNDGRYIDVNDAYLQAGKYKRDDIIGRTESELGCWVNPDDRNRLVSLLREQGIVNNEEVNFRIKPGVILKVLWSAETIDIKGEIYIIAVILDITERKMLENQLLQSQKMEAVGQLAGGVAHDFNNILTAIISYGYLLKKKLKEGDPLNENIDKILLLANRASSITQGLLTFSRKRYLELSPVKLNDIISSSEKLLSKFIGEDIAIRTRLTHKQPVIIADRIQMEQVIVNLATNARDAMPNGGTLTIETELVQLDDNFIKYHGFGRTGLYAYLAVTDTGQGISEDMRQKIFEPFFTTKDVGKGTGLGLAITYGIIRQHLGYINIYSEPGKGTTFKIYLPAAKESAAVGRSAKLPLLAGKSETILVVEDDATVRDSVSKMLKEFGYKVIEAVSGEDAVEKFTLNREHINLLLLDVVMPGMNGRETYDRIKGMDPAMKVIFTSGYTPEFLKQKKVFDNDFMMLTKPIVPDSFLARIREVLDETGKGSKSAEVRKRET